LIGSLSTSGSALVAQRTRLDVISGNLANAFATVREDGAIEPYRRRIVTFAARDEQGRPGVHVHEILEDESEFRLEYDPGHQHAIPEGPMAGYVRYPNVNIAAEYVDAMLAARAFEANVAMMNVTRSMLQQAMQVLA
jgi:flagellar basal-body rod protein FlgC